MSLSFAGVLPSKTTNFPAIADVFSENGPRPLHERQSCSTSAQGRALAAKGRSTTMITDVFRQDCEKCP